MPARKRRHRPEPESPDPLVRFGKALAETKERERQRSIRAHEEHEEAKRLARLAAEHIVAVERAQRHLEEAIADVKRARVDHRSAVVADAADVAYRIAKAHLIELETGARPAWALGTDDQQDDTDGTDDTPVVTPM